jgi:hypothetical protein
MAEITNTELEQYDDRAQQLVLDVKRLIAEVRRLRAENERLREEKITETQGSACQYCGGVGYLQKCTWCEGTGVRR